MGIGHTLHKAIEELSQSITNANDLTDLTLKLDLLASELLRTPLVKERLGPERAAKLAGSEAEVSDVLHELGGQDFEDVARPAEELVEVISSSALEEVDDGVIEYAEGARKDLVAALTRVDELMKERG